MTQNTLRSTSHFAAIVVTVMLVLASATTAQAASVGRPDRTPAPEAGSGGRLEPQAPPARTGDEVVLEVGDNFAQIVAAHPAGTHFRIAEGVHVGQAVTPRDGDTFTGDAGAILTGAVPMATDDFSREGNVWVADNQTTEAFRNQGDFHGEMVPGFERDAANNDLWAGDTRLQHVASRALVDSPTEWFFDYDADQIIVGVDPATTPLALSTPWSAFDSDADDVTIQHLTITRYASFAQNGAILSRGDGWRVHSVTVTENHGAGITIGPEGHVTDSRITWNGQIGVTSWAGEGIRVERNEIAYNRTLGYNWGWEGGGTKFKESTDLVVNNNWVHDNFGPGIWFDIDNVDSVITSNLIHDNLVGILVEISYGAVISDNTIRDNGAGGYGDVGSGLWVSNSSGVEVHRNLFERNRCDLIATHMERGSGAFGRYETKNLLVHDNAFRIDGEVRIGLRVGTGEDEFYSERGNVFQNNSYRLDDTDDAFWWNGDRDVNAWQSLGLDVEGRFTTAEDVAPPQQSSYAAVGYGHSA